MPTSTPDPQPPKGLRLGRSPWLLALAVLLLVGVLALLGWLALNQGSPGQQDFEGGGVRMTIPGDWEFSDITQNQACTTTPTLECVVILTAPQGYNFSVTWYQQTDAVDVATVDAREWKKFVEYYPNAILFSREDLQISGQPAIRRTFLQNDPLSTPVYFQQMYVVDGLRLYLITARFYSAEMLELESPTVDAVLESIEFTGEE